MTKLIKVQCNRENRTEDSGDIFYVDKDKFNRIKGTSATIWGQVSETDDSGWFYFANELDEVV